LYDSRFSSTIEREMQQQRDLSWLAGRVSRRAGPQPRALRLAAWSRPSLVVLLTAGLVLSNCGGDEALDSRPTTPIEPDGGDDSGTSGSNAASGSGAAGPLGGSSGKAGEGPESGGMPGGGSLQGGGPPSAGAGGGSDGPLSEQLSFGLRIPAPSQNATDVARAYNQATYDDCRTRWVTNLFLDKQPSEQHLFLNALVTWNYNFWGCDVGVPPVSNFALIWGEAPLSAGDAALLIEHYIAVATAELTLSPPEITEMRAALERLAAPLIEDPSLEPSQSQCDTGSAGAGGMPAEPTAGGAAGVGPINAAGHGGVQ
jgi:hypothetical protein